MTDRELLELLLNKITGIEEEIVSIKGTMAAKEEIVHIKETMATKEEIAHIKETMATKEEISSIKETMATKEDVTELPFIKRAVQDTADTVKRIESTQERHERTLDLLSRRSIDQEAELKRIK